jgi:Cu(I)/Ag(I) efflux system membrane fusion protein
MSRNVIAIAWLIAVLGAMPSCKNKEDGADPVERIDATTLRVSKDALENLKFARAAVLDFPEQLNLMGKVSVTEDRTTVVPARAAGRTDAIYFASGETVKAGQLLMTLFSPDFSAAKEEYVQSLKQSRNAAGGADPSDFANLTQLARRKLETMGLTEADIEGLAASDSKQDLMPIRAPRSGVIIAKAAVLGNLVNVGDTLFTIGDLSKVWFSGDIYPEDLPKVKKGQEVVVNVEGLGEPVHGVVNFISPLVDPATRSIKIRALMDNPKGYLRADMYVQGSVTINSAKALLVPTPALVRGPDRYFAFKRKTPPTVEAAQGAVEFVKVNVQPGAEKRGLTAVLSGLQEGDEVVTEGAWLLDAALNTEKK